MMASSRQMNGMAPLCLVLLGLAFGILAISNESLWIDEACTAEKAATLSWDAFGDVMILRKGSDLQMPLYMAWMRVWGSTFGLSEVVLRGANLVWYALTLTCLALGFRHRPRLASFAILFTAVSPFMWQYLNEARPYAMQMCGAFLLVLALIRWFDPKCLDDVGPFDWFCLVVGSILLCGTSLLGVLFAGPGLAVWLLWGLLGKWPRTVSWRNAAPWILSGMVVLLALGAYYAWTLATGGGAAKLGGEGLMSLVFAVYELCGFSGLGPGRLAIRVSRIAAFKPFLLPLAALAIAYGAVLLLSVRWKQVQNVFKEGGTLLLLAAMWVVVPIVILVALSELSGFRLLGRHLAPLLPVWALGLAWVCCGGLHPLSKAANCAVLLLAILLLTSGLMMRFSPRHAKDDYRSAVASTLPALNDGQTVWWAADLVGWSYYANPDVPDPLFLMNETAEETALLPAPDLVVLSKPDLYDRRRATRDYLEAHDATLVADLHAFRVWKVNNRP